MSEIQQVVDAIGHNRLKSELQRGDGAIHNAISRGKFPSAWYLVVTRLAKEAGVKCSDSLFTFKENDNPPEKVRSPDAITGNSEKLNWEAAQ